MLTVKVLGIDYFDEENSTFITSEDVTLELEHSLVSLSKWESVWGKPFLGPDLKTTEETLSYIKAMSLTPNIAPEVFSRLSNSNLEEINEYISAKMTATSFIEKQTKSREIVTSEVIYYWMISLNVPFSCETWHLNRLFTLLKVCSEKNSPKKKMSKREIAARNTSLNAQRLAELKTTG